jgi:hypothetical protein
LLSYLSLEEKTRCPQPAQVYTPRRFSEVSGLEYGCSVCSRRSAAYCSDVKSARHSSSVRDTTSAGAASAGRASRKSANALALPTKKIRRSIMSPLFFPIISDQEHRGHLFVVALRPI